MPVTTRPVFYVPREIESTDFYDPQPTEKQPLVINFRLNNHYVSGVIDTGASVSLVPDDAPAISNLLIKPTAWAVKGASGRDIEVKGEVKAQVRVGTSPGTTVTFLVARVSRVLVAWADIRQLKLTIDGSTGTVFDSLGNEIESKTSVKTLMQYAIDVKIKMIDMTNVETMDSESDDDEIDNIKGDSDERFGEWFCANDKKELTKLIEQMKLIGQPDEFIDVSNTSEIRQEFTEPPVSCQNHNLSQEQKQHVADELLRLEKVGVYNRVEQGIQTMPCFTILKKDRSFRLIADARRTNTITVPMECNVPKLEAILAGMVGDIFSTIDVKSAYYTLSLHKEDRRYFRTRCPLTSQLFECGRLVMGAKNAPQLWTVFINKLTKDLDVGLVDTKLVVYMDDLVVITKHKNVKEHKEALVRVFKLLHKNRLKANRKMKLAFKKLELFGYMVSADGRAPSPSRVAALVNMPRPVTSGLLLRWLSSINYYRTHITDWSKITACLYRAQAATKPKTKKIAWTTELTTAYAAAVETFKQSVSLTAFDSDKPVEITVDASKNGFGGTLSQNGKLCFVFNRKSSAAEQIYNSHALELVGLCHLLERFAYLFRHNTQIRVSTDSMYVFLAVVGHFTVKTISLGRSLILTTLLKLSKFNILITHRSGKSPEMALADCLSREGVGQDQKVVMVLSRSAKQIPITIKTLDQLGATINTGNKANASDHSVDVNAIDVTAPKRIVDWDKLKQLIKMEQKASKACQRNVALLQEQPKLCRGHRDDKCVKPTCMRAKKFDRLQRMFQVKDDILYYRKNNSFMLFIPDGLRSTILKTVHESMNLHLSPNLVCSQLENNAIWGINLYRLLLDLVLECESCTMFKQYKTNKSNSPQRPLPHQPLMDLSCDNMKIGLGQGSKTVLVTVDNFTKLVQTAVVRDETAVSITQGLLSIIANNRLPYCVRTDNGSCFTSEYFANFLRAYNIMHRTIIPLNSRGNLCESAIKRLQAMMRLLNENYHNMTDDDFVLAVHTATVMVNSRPLTEIQKSPYELMWGAAYTSFYTPPIPKMTKKVMNKALVEYHKEAEKRQDELFKRNVESQQKRVSVKTTLQLGDHVRIRIPNSKFGPKWSKEIYRITLLKNNAATVMRFHEDFSEEERLKFTVRRIHTRMLRKIKLQSPAVTGQTTDDGKDGAECAKEIDQEEHATRTDSPEQNIEINNKGEEGKEGAIEKDASNSKEGNPKNGQHTSSRYNLRQRIKKM